MIHSTTEEVGGRHWFALQTRSRHEKVVRDELVKRNIENFLPLMTRLSQWTDRKKKVEFPLFSGYCFARFTLEARLPVLQSTGVVCIIGSNGRPESIPASEIESLMIVMSNRTRYDVYPYLREGMPVEVIRGPLQGVKGRVIRYAKFCRVVISISLIQQAIVVEIDASSITPVSAIDPCHQTSQRRTDVENTIYSGRRIDQSTEHSRSHEM